MRWSPFGAPGPVRRARCGRRRPAVERLETRSLLTLTVTPAEAAAGFSLSTFASDFPMRSDGLGPFGVLFLPTGGVMVDDGPGNVRVFPTDSDGQDAANVPPAPGASYGQSNVGGIAKVGDHIYLMMGQRNQVAEVNPDGTLKRVVVSLPNADGVAVDPFNGHLFVSGYNSAIYDVDPVAGTSSVFVNVAADGLAFDLTTGILYAAYYPGSPGDKVLGFDVNTKQQVFDSGTISGGPDGIGLGTGTLAGDLFVNTNGGTVYEVNLATKAQTVIATGGTRGDFVAVDPNNGTLMMSQSDRLVRLIPPTGGGFQTPATDLAITAGTPTVPLASRPDLIAFPFTVTNNGPADARSVAVHIPVPGGTVFSSETHPASFTPAAPAVGGSGAIDYTAPLLAANATATFTVMIEVRPGTTAGARIVDTAKVSAATPETNLANNSVTATATFTPPVTTPTDGPGVLGVLRYGYHAQPTVLVVRFNAALNPSPAQFAPDYYVVGPAGGIIHVVSASYDPSTASVTLALARRLNLHYTYRLVINGTGPFGVRGADGLLLDGGGTGRPGSNNVTTLTAANLVVTPGPGALQALLLSSRARAGQLAL